MYRHLKSTRFFFCPASFAWALALFLTLPNALISAQEIPIKAGTVIAVQCKVNSQGSDERTIYNLYEASADFGLSVYGETFVERDAELLKSFEEFSVKLDRDMPAKQMEIYPTGAKQLDFDGQDIGMTAGAVYIMQGKWSAVGGAMPAFKINEHSCYRVQPTKKQAFQCFLGPSWEHKKTNVVDVAAGSIIAMEVRISEGRIYKTVWNLYETSDDFQMNVPSKGKVVSDANALAKIGQLTDRLSPIGYQERARTKELPPINQAILNSNGEDVGMSAGAMYVIEGGWQAIGAQPKFKIFENGCQRFELDQKQSFNFSRGITWNGENP